MSIKEDLEFRISIVGPSRVGKTSLIATLLKDAERLLEGTSTKIVPNGTPTKQKIADHDNELQGALWAGEFNPGAVAGTEEPFKFELRLDPGVGSGLGLRFGLLDFPGGWIDDGRRPTSREAEWEECRVWFDRSSVLILPVEATVIMEAVANSHKRAVPAILNISQVEGIVREWAKARSKAANEPALIILCPVKCESYFSDNGGRQDKSNELLAAIQYFFGGALRAARKEMSSLNVIYAPVDTIGCVELVRADWRCDNDKPGKFDFSAEYRVRGAGERAPMGAHAVLISLCRHLMEVKKLSEDRITAEKVTEADMAKHIAEADEGLLQNFWLFISRERKRREEAACRIQSDADKQQKIAKRLGEIISDLAARPLGERVRTLT